MPSDFSPLRLKRGLLLFWAIYFAIVLASNLADGLKALKILPEGWAFASGNYGLMVKVTRIYGVPYALVAMLFAGVCLWEAAAVYGFARAFRHFAGVGTAGMSMVYQAFGTALGLWAAFLIADELLIVYDRTSLEAAHLTLFLTHLLSLLALRLLPDD